MGWDGRCWNRYLRKVRSALVKRDILRRGECSGVFDPAWEKQLQRERRAWAAEAKAYLRGLAILARQAPDPFGAGRILAELRLWFEEPCVDGPRGPRQLRYRMAGPGSPNSGHVPSLYPPLLGAGEKTCPLRPEKERPLSPVPASPDPQTPEAMANV